MFSIITTGLKRRCELEKTNFKLGSLEGKQTKVRNQIDSYIDRLERFQAKGISGEKIERLKRKLKEKESHRSELSERIKAFKTAHPDFVGWCFGENLRNGMSMASAMLPGLTAASLGIAGERLRNFFADAQVLEKDENLKTTLVGQAYLSLQKATVS